jgi:hypothetical protein
MDSSRALIRVKVFVKRGSQQGYITIPKFRECITIKCAINAARGC